jgi:hypothetical protein
MVSEEIIEEAAKEGIVPGAVIRCLADSDDIATVPETSEWVIDNGDLYFETSGPCIVIRYGDGSFATVITPAPSSETLEPGMATKCGPAMRAAIMERAKELGVMDPSSKEKDTTEGIWVLDFGLQKGMLHTCTYSNSEGLKFIPNHEFLRRLENTKPPKRELTTEEKLAEAIDVFTKIAGIRPMHPSDKYGDGGLAHRCAELARDFLKSIKP